MNAQIHAEDVIRTYTDYYCVCISLQTFNTYHELFLYPPVVTVYMAVWNGSWAVLIKSLSQPTNTSVISLRDKSKILPRNE